MNISQAVDALAALAQETRLNIFRLLVRHAPLGLPAGQIARRLRLPGPTLSFHLSVLAGAGLVEPHKNGRSIRYAPLLDTVDGLAGFLVENCCTAGARNRRGTTRCEPSCIPVRHAQSRKLHGTGREP